MISSQILMHCAASLRCLFVRDLYEDFTRKSPSRRAKLLLSLAYTLRREGIDPFDPDLEEAGPNTLPLLSKVGIGFFGRGDVIKHA